MKNLKLIAVVALFTLTTTMHAQTNYQPKQIQEVPEDVLKKVLETE